MKRVVLFTMAMLAATAMLAQTSGGPDSYGYTWKNSSHTVTPPVYQWFDISQIGIEVGGLGDDNIVGPISAVQGFQFYWYPVSQFWIGSNGYISFNGDNIASPFPAGIPLPTGANNWIAPLMGDLNFGGTGNTAKCYYWSNADTLCVSWIDVPFWTNNAVGYSGSNTFQVILNKVDKSVTFNYLSTNLGLGTLDIAIGIENSTGTLGLASMLDALPAALTSIKFYYPTTVTYAVTDGGMEWNGNASNGGVFVKKGVPHALTAKVRNYGNQVLGAFTVRDTVLSSASVAVTSGSVAVPGLAVQTDYTVNFPNTFTPATAGTYRFNTSIAGITGDMVAANDRKTQEIIAIDTALTTMILDYSNGVAGGGGLSWQGGNGGIAVYITPPKYPVRIAGTRFLVTANTSFQGFYAMIFKDDGPNKSPGSRIDSVFVGSANILTGVYTTVPVGNPNLYIDSGGVYVLWYMAGPDINLGRDNTPPISYRTYEVLGGMWADYRDKFSEDFCMGLDVTQPSPLADFTYSTINDPNVSFTDNSSYNPTAWSWNFGDGMTSLLQNPTHTYVSVGTYNVCLTATNAFGNNVKCKSITISNGAPVAMFTYNASASPGVQFTDASGGNPTAWKWDFDDIGADSSNAQNPFYYFYTNGNHNVCLTVTNSMGTSTPYCQTVTITGIGAPVAMFTYDAANSPAVTFTDASTGTPAPTAWRWDFDDIGADSSALQNPVYTFQTNGGHNVCLITTNSIGPSAPFCLVVPITGIGIAHPDGAGKYHLYPNPMTDRMKISLPSSYSGAITELRVYHLAGSRVKVDYTIQGAEIGLVRGDLSQGFYFFEVYAGNERITNGRFTVK
jgi:PKD repeat protein